MSGKLVKSIALNVDQTQESILVKGREKHVGEKVTERPNSPTVSLTSDILVISFFNSYHVAGDRNTCLTREKVLFCV